MRLQHNTIAANVSRNLSIVWKNQGRLAEKLSTGFSINRASDNAAGLKISEKMRTQIRGLNQASRNVQDGISLLQTADGALNEVHSILQRVRELTVQAANDTNVSADRESIQEEINELLKEVDRIGGTTEFNTKKLFVKDVNGVSDSSHLEKMENGVYIYNIENDYDTIQTEGPANNLGSYQKLGQVLKEEIVPQAVKRILDVYSDGFGYLKDCKVGIGLKIINNSDSSALASVSAGLSGNSQKGYTKQYCLTVNTAYLQFNSDGSLKDGSRSELEGTILHEMIHGFMYESNTNGMMGVENGKSNSEVKYPLWFVEGMAQTAVGGYAPFNDWVRGGLRIDSSKTESEIKDNLLKSKNHLGGNSSYSSYGTGYLAVMYMGMMASGESIAEENVTSENMRKGINYILNAAISGDSLDNIISDISGGTYKNVSEFESKFGDVDSVLFVKYLTKKVDMGNGSLMAENLTDTEMLPNEKENTGIFALNDGVTYVKNTYPSGVNVLSGGTKSSTGTKPTPDYTEIEKPDPTKPSTPVNTFIDLSKLGVSKGDGYAFDGKTLTLNGNGTYSISGSKNNIEIKVAKGVKADININKVNLNTADSAITVENGAEIKIKVAGDNTFSSKNAPAIKVDSGATVTFAGNGTIQANTEDSNGAAAIGSEAGNIAGTIIIDGDTTGALVINANSKTGSDSIGSGKGIATENVVKKNGIIIDSQNGGSCIFGNNAINSTINIGDQPINVLKGAIVTVKHGGLIKTDDSAGIVNDGTIHNHGIIQAPVTGSGKLNQYIQYQINNVKFKMPAEPQEGKPLELPTDTQLSITVNGKKYSLKGTWSVKDKDGNLINDLASHEVKKGNTYIFSVTFVAQDGQFFEKDGENAFESLNGYEDLNQVNLSDDMIMTGESFAMSLQGTEVSDDGTSLTFHYQSKAKAPAKNPDEGDGSSETPNQGIHLQVGANEGQSIVLDLGEVSTKKLGLEKLSVMSYEDATDAIDRVDKSITNLSSIRSRIGAYQNRLEFTIDNLDNTAENLQAAESRIRDLDIVKAMVEYSKNQILIQAGQSILAQANQSTSNVLALLQA